MFAPLKNKQGAQQTCRKEPLCREENSSSCQLFSSDQYDGGSCCTYMFLWVKRLLFAASLLASDSSTILCSSDLIFESIALII